MNKTIQLIAALICSFIISLPLAMAQEMTISNVQSEILNDHQAKISWTTSEPSTGQVMYGESAPTRIVTTGTTQDTNQSVTLNVLGGTSYVYEIVAQNESGAETTNNNGGAYFTFTTPETITISNINTKVVAETTTGTIKYEINWTTDKQTDNNFVLYGESQDNLNQSMQGASSADTHVIQIDLEKGKKYYYAVKSSYLQANAGSITVPYDITPPEISIDKFSQKTKDIITAAFTNSSTLPVNGTVEANATLNFYVNNLKRLTLTADETGAFDGQAALIDGLNKFDVQISDQAGNKNHYYFNITSDSTPPQITLTNFQTTSLNKTTWVNGTLSENGSVIIKNNAQTVLDVKDVNSFAVEIQLTEQNNITITATDKAGNTNTIQQTTGMLPPPKILMTSPTERPLTNGVMEFQTAVWKIKLEGITSPNSRIAVYTYPEGGNMPSKPLFNTTSDSEGKFKIENVWIYNCQTSLDTLFEGKDPTQFGGGTTDQIRALMGCGANETRTRIVIVPTDQYGRAGENKTIRAIQKRCGKGDDFTVTVTPDPHAFKPYRLKDGSEVLSIQVELIWKGASDLKKINTVNIRPAPFGEEYKTPTQRGLSEVLPLPGISGLTLTNPKDYECADPKIGNVFSSNMQPITRVASPNGTTWFFMYKLNKWTGLNDTTIKEWDDLYKKGKGLFNSKCNLPLQVEISYDSNNLFGTPEDLNQGVYEPGKSTTDTQITCFETSNLIQSDIDPNLVIPEWLLNGSINLLDSTKKFLDAIAGPIETINKGLSIACLVYVGKTFWSKISTAKACVPAYFAAQKGDPSLIQSCEDAIKDEKLVYNHYRTVCDRVLCKTTPVNPVGQENQTLAVTADMVKILKPQNNKCAPVDRFYCAKNIEDAAMNCDPNYKNERQLGTTPDYKNIAPNILQWTTSDCNAADNQPGDICCMRAQYYDKQVSQIVYVKADDTTSNPNSKYPFWNGSGGGINPTVNGTGIFDNEWFVDQEWNYGQWTGYGGETFTPATTTQTPTPADKSKEFATAYAAGQSIKAQLADKRANDPNNIQYYVDGYNAPSCFGEQSAGFLGNKPFAEPSTNFVDAVKCGCVSQVNGYVQQYSNLVGQMQQCLKTVQAGGNYTAGACRELFTKFVCDIFSWIIVEGVLNKMLGTNQNHKIADTKELSPAQIAGMGISAAASSFQEDYGSAFAGRFDLGANSLTHSVCLMAFTREWDPNLLGVIGGEAGGPPRATDAAVTTAEREILGITPKGLASTEYRIGVWATLGSDLRRFEIWLVCDADGDCPAVEDKIPFRTVDGTFQGVITNADQLKKNQVLQPGGRMIVTNKDHRYNKIRVCWTSTSTDPKFSAKSPPDCVERAITDFGAGTAFGCDIQPTLAETGNNVFKCAIYSPEDYSSFTQPPTNIRIDVTDEGQRIKIPFSIEAHYGTRDQYTQSYILKQERKGTKPQTIEKQIPEGFSTSETYPGFIAGIADFAAAGQTIDTTPNCPIHGDGSSPSSNPGTVVIVWPSTIDQVKSGPPTITGSATEIKWDATTSKLTFKQSGVGFTADFWPNRTCSVTTKLPTAATNEVKVDFAIGIYEPHPSNPNTAGSSVWSGQQEQVYDPITVTLVNKIGQQNTPTSQTAPITITVNGNSNTTLINTPVTILLSDTQGRNITSAIIQVASLSYSETPTINSPTWNSDTSTIRKITFDQTQMGQQTIFVKATDQDGKEATYSKTINVTKLND